MIISRGRRYIFVHIPKTGGTALSLALENRAMADDILIGDTPKAVRRKSRIQTLKASGRLWKHSRLSDIHGIVSDSEMSQFFVLTLIRNPWDRMVSYYHWLREQSFKHVAVEVAKQKSFDEFLDDAYIQSSIKSSPYAGYVTDRNGCEHCNVFVRIEHLATDLKPFEKHLGFSLQDIQHVNSSTRDSDYRIYYNDEKAALVARLCEIDIKRFDYRF